MLWDAGQDRVVREERARLTELFMAVRDAQLDVLVATQQVKPRGTWRLPAYIASSDAPTAALGTPAQRDRALARLGAMFPGMVRRRDDA